MSFLAKSIILQFIFFTHLSPIYFRDTGRVKGKKNIQPNELSHVGLLKLLTKEP